MNGIDAWQAARDKIIGPFAFIYTMIQQLIVYCNILNFFAPRAHPYHRILIRSLVQPAHINNPIDFRYFYFYRLIW